MIGNLICFVLGTLFGVGIAIATHDYELNRLIRMAEEAEKIADFAMEQLVKLEEAKDEQDAAREG